MTDNETPIAKLRTSIAQQEQQIAAVPARAAQMRKDEEAAMLTPLTHDYMEQTKGDWPSDGLLRMLPALKTTLRETQARLDALLSATANHPATPPTFRPTREICDEADALRARIGELERRMAEPATGTVFDNTVRGEYRTSLGYARNRLRDLVACYPSLAEELPDVAESGGRAKPSGPTRDELLKEPTVQQAHDTRGSPFPPTVERVASQDTTKRRRR